MHTRRPSLITELGHPRAFLLSLLFLSAGSCYQLDQTSGKFYCDHATDVCPEGMVCVNQRCVVPVEGGDLSVAMPMDLAAPPDLRAPPDLPAPVDMTMRPDVAGPVCSNVVPGAVVACPGVVTGGRLGVLCQSGYHPCIAADPRFGGQNVGALSACTNLTGFYAADIDISVKEGKDGFECKAAGDGPRALLGCGSGTGTGNLNMAKDCPNTPLLRVFPCGTQGDWSCTSVADAANRSGQGGTLCCRD